MGFKLPTVNHFLCCFELETGGFVVGWVVAVLSVLGIIGCISFTVSGFVILGDENYDQTAATSE